MKRIVLMLLIAVFTLAGVLPLYGSGQTTIVLTIGKSSTQVNGNSVQLDVAPFIKDGRTFVPLRFVSEQLGARVSYTTKADGSVDQVTITMGTEVASASPTPTPTPTPTPIPPPPAPSGWREIARWTGNSSKSTEMFTVPNEWRLTWSCNGSGWFSVNVYSSNGDSFKLVTISTEPGGDTSNFHQGGQFYLDIASTVGYTVVIEGLF